MSKRNATVGAAIGFGLALLILLLAILGIQPQDILDFIGWRNA